MIDNYAWTLISDRLDALEKHHIENEKKIMQLAEDISALTELIESLTLLVGKHVETCV